MIKRVLVTHVPYKVRGGEDVHVDFLLDAYKSIGIEPVLYPFDRNPPGMSPGAAIRSLSTEHDYQDFEKDFAHSKIDAVHLHNIYPSLGPRFLHFLTHRKIPVFMSVHSHRLFCANGVALRWGKSCYACMGDPVNVWKPILYNCNGNPLKSAYYAHGISRSRANDWIRKSVTVFLAPSPYIAEMTKKWGADPKRIVTIPIPVSTPDLKNAHGVELVPAPEYDVFYAGRLSKEKGIDLLLKAAKLHPGIHFAIAGRGALEGKVKKAVKELANLRYFGGLTREEIFQALAKSKMAIMPSVCNESFGQFAIEAFLSGKPCILSDQEAFRWFAEDPYSGVLFKSGDVEAMIATIQKELKTPHYTFRTLMQRQEKLRAFFQIAEYGKKLGDLIGKIAIP